MNEKSSRVAIVDDHDSVVIGVREAFRNVEGIEFVGGAYTVDQLLENVSAMDIAILDLRLADGSSPVRNAGRLADAGAQVIAYSSGEHPNLIRLAARAEIVGFVRKSEPLFALIDAVNALRAGEVLMSADLASALYSDPRLGAVGLSAQEQHVLALFANGLKTESVARELGIATGTANDYIRRIRAKYARAGRPAHTKVDLYKRALEDGLLPLPDRDID